MYDDTCRFLAEHFSADFASWLLGKSVALTEIQPSELSLDPIRADAMILLQSAESILHIKFQTRPKEEIPFRMLDYRVRGQRRCLLMGIKNGGVWGFGEVVWLATDFLKLRLILFSYCDRVLHLQKHRLSYREK